MCYHVPVNKNQTNTQQKNGGNNMKYTISYEKNGICQAIGVNAQTAAQAAAVEAEFQDT